MDQGGEGNVSSRFMTGCCDVAHGQRKVHSEEVLGSFGPKLRQAVSFQVS